MSKKSITVSLVGMRYHTPPFKTHSAIKQFPIHLECEPTNPNDANAVKVLISGHTVGHLDRESALTISSLLKKGVCLIVSVPDAAITSSARTIQLVVEAETSTSKPIRPVSGAVSGIYRISVCDRKWVYIGQAIDINKRFAVHWKDFSFDCHANRALQEKWRQYGEKSFVGEVIEVAPNEMSALDRQRWLGARERHWISESRKTSNCLNVTDGEIVATKLAQTQFDQQESAHDALIRESKKEIQLEASALTLASRSARESQRVTTQKVEQLEKFIDDNTGVRGFFFGHESSATVETKKMELKQAKAMLAKINAVVSGFDSKIAALNASHQALKTSKQRQQAINKVMSRFGRVGASHKTSIGE